MDIPRARIFYVALDYITNLLRWLRIHLLKPRGQREGGMAGIVVEELTANALSDHLNDLAEILHRSVINGASVGFIQPYTLRDSQAFWEEKVFPSVREGRRILWGAGRGARVVGTVQLDIDMLPNQTHRGEVAKLLVHPDCRKRGIAKLLMAALEERARGLQKRLLTLDTRTGDAAEPLYSTLGYQTAGIIPGYCRSAEDDRDDATTYMYKALSSESDN